MSQSLQPTDLLQKIEQLQHRNLALEQQVLNLSEQLQAAIAGHQQVKVAPQPVDLVQEVGRGDRFAERMQVEEALRQTNEQFQAVLDAVPGLVTWIDSNLRYLGVNCHAAQAFNLPTESFIGREVGFLNSSPQFNQFVRQLFASSEKTGSKEMVSNVNGVSRTYLIVGQKYNQNQAAVFVGTDVTQLKQTEIDLRQSLQRLSDFKYALDQAAILSIADAQGVISYVNEKYCKISQHSEAELIGKNHRWLSSSCHSEAFFQALWSTISAGKVWHGEMQNQAKDGTCYWLDTTIAPFLDDAGRPCQYLFIQTDITDRKQIETDVQQTLDKEKHLNRLKSRFISMTSHEFRTPLAVIASSAAILKSFGHKLNEEQKLKHLVCIQNYVDHTTHLLDDILLINQAETGSLAFDLELLNLENFCTLLVEEMQLHAPEHSIDFSCTADNPTDSGEADYSVYADKKLLHQILVNLLSNAVKFSSAGSSIQFDLKLQPNQAVFQVVDAGIGIPIDDQPHIFDAFNRGSNVDTAPGNGLGLSIVKQCLDLHGGSINFNSEVNRGSAFTVSLPLQTLPSCIERSQSQPASS